MSRKPFSKRSFSALKKNIALTDEEKSNMRVRLMEYASMRPVRGESVLPSHRKRSGFADFFTSLGKRRFAGAFAIVLMVLVGGGATARASDKALPGEPFYSLKTNVLEPVRGAFVRADQDKAKWKMNLAIKRLAEAEDLAARGALSDEVRLSVTESFEHHVRDFEELAVEIESKAPDPSALLALRSDYEAKLDAHLDVLTVIETQVSEEHQSNIERLVSVVSETALRALSARSKAELAFGGDEMSIKSGLQNRAQDEIVSGSALRATTAVETRVAPSTPVPVEDVEDKVLKVRSVTNTDPSFNRQNEEVRRLIKQAETRLKVSRSLIDESIALKTETKIMQAQEAFEEAHYALEDGNRSEAYRLLFEARRKAVEADILAENQSRVNLFHKGIYKVPVNPEEIVSDALESAAEALENVKIEDDGEIEMYIEIESISSPKNKEANSHNVPRDAR